MPRKMADALHLLTTHNPRIFNHPTFARLDLFPSGFLSLQSPQLDFNQMPHE